MSWKYERSKEGRSFFLEGHFFKSWEKLEKTLQPKLFQRVDLPVLRLFDFWSTDIAYSLWSLSSYLSSLLFPGNTVKIVIIFLSDTWHLKILGCQVLTSSYLLLPAESKDIWEELGSKLGRHALKIIALTSRPWFRFFFFARRSKTSKAWR